MVRPVRIQRRRVKGYDLQRASLAANGLPVRYVGRPTSFGNPADCTCARRRWSPCGVCVDDYRLHLVSGLEGTSSLAVGLPFEVDRRKGYPWRTALVAALPTLRGHNLACWCALDRPCHADVLLEIANGQG